tara:strand:- start:12 stop:608 length:597 start_codon:yes stop_codon:yes gene_type:complete
MSVTKFDICAQALIMIGAQPITSFEDGTTEAIACANLYENAVRDQLARYRWRFSVGQVQLSRLVTAPSTKWDAAYQLPATCLQLITVMVNGNPVRFDRYEDRVFCDASEADEVYLEGVFRIDESYWPPYFVTLMIYSMASMLAFSVAQQENLSALMEQRALRQGAISRSIDAQGRTAPRIDTDRLVTVRYRGTRRETY